MPDDAVARLALRLQQVNRRIEAMRVELSALPRRRRRERAAAPAQSAPPARPGAADQLVAGVASWVFYEAVPRPLLVAVFAAIAAVLAAMLFAN